ncbi:MAG: TonB-dependent receptor, partial [Bryobacteraceae bacterium]|nr:TonB-dependent receptor [Bryobacteraceae bacterium]
FGTSGTNTATNTLTNSFRINGGRAATNEVLLDGAANTTAFSNQTAGLPQVDAVQEFRVLTSPYAPEYGRTSGGVISFGLRSGSNDFHGSLHHFLRNSVLDANGFNANRAGRPRQQLQRNQFGGVFSGPVWIPKLYQGKNKTFFFFGYEGLRERQAGSFLGTVPTELERRGDFSQTRDVTGPLIQMFDPATTRLDPAAPAGTTRFIRDLFPGNVIPGNRIQRIGQNLLSFYPTANQPGRGQSSVENFFSAAPSQSDQNRVDVKIDHALTSNHQIMGRYNWYKNENRIPSPYGNVASPSTSNSLPGASVQGRHTWTIGPRDLFEHSFVYGFSESGRTTPGAGYDPLQLGFAPSTVTGIRVPAFPAITANRLSPTGLAALAVSSNRPEVYQYRATLTWIRGNHTMKMGVDWRLLAGNIIIQPPLAIGATNNFTGGPNPAAAALASGSGIADLLLGAASVTASIVPFEQVRRPYYGVFFQDEWRINPKLTVTYGLRYNLELAFREKDSQYAYFDYAAASPIANRVPSIPNLRGGLVYPEGAVQRTDRNNFDPRLGIAYRLNEKTVIRTGYGLSYYTGRFGFTGGTLSTQFPVIYNIQEGVAGNFRVEGTADSLPAFQLIPIPNNGTINPAPNQGYFTVPKTNPIPMVHSYSFTVQRQLGATTTLDVAYVGTLGRRIPGQRELNFALPGQGAAGLAFNQRFGRTASVAERANAYNNNYHALQVNLQRRFAAGLSLQAAYTWSRTMGVGDDQPGFTIPGFVRERH